MTRPSTCAALVLLLVADAAGATASDSLAPEPVRLDAVEAILSAFDRCPLVALGEAAHHSPRIYRFYDQLLDHPDFPSRFDAVVFEVANAAYQPVIDRYVAGEDVSPRELRRVWRDASNSAEQSGDFPLYESFFAKVRALNARLPKARQVRILAGDPAFDWAELETRDDHSAILSSREAHYAAVAIREVLEKDERALLLMGNGHFYRHHYRNSGPGVREIIERAHPGSICVVNMHGDADIYRRLATWPTPSIAFVKDTWIGALPVSRHNPTVRLEDDLEAILYLGPPAEWPTQATVPFVKDDPYRPEHERRRRILGAGPFAEGRSGDRGDGGPKEVKQLLLARLHDLAEITKKHLRAAQDTEIRTFRGALDLGACTDRELRVVCTIEEEDVERDGVRLRATRVTDWTTREPEVAVTVFLSQQDFAILDVEYR